MKRRTHAIDFADARVERDGPGKAPTAFRLWKAGENQSDDGPIFFTRESAAKLLAEQEERARTYSSDFDHLSLERNRPALAGRASGYHRLEVRTDENGEPELWAVAIEWTKDAREGLEQDPPLWRYYSPAFLTDKEEQIVSYLNFALCINPKTHDLPSLANVRAASQGATVMTRAEALALHAKICSEDSSDEEKKEARDALRKYIEEEATFPEEKPEGEKAPDSEKGEGDKPKADEDAKKAAGDEELAKKAAADDEAKRAEESKRAHAAKAGDVIDAAINAAVAERMRPFEIAALLDEKSKTIGNIPEATRKLCMSAGTLDEAKRLVASFESGLRQNAAGRPTTATVGKHAHGNDPEMLEEGSKERQELDEGMGIKKHTVTMPGRDEHGTFKLHAVTPANLRNHLAEQAAKAAKGK